MDANDAPELLRSEMGINNVNKQLDEHVLFEKKKRKIIKDQRIQSKTQHISAQRISVHISHDLS